MARGFDMPYVIDEKLVKDVKDSIKGQDEPFLKHLMDEMRPADLADLIEHLDPEERVCVFDLIEPEGAGEVLVEMEPPFQERLLEGLDDEHISEIVQELDSDDAADVVGDLPADRAKHIIEKLEDDVSEELEILLPYPEDTAGGIMALEFVAVRENETVQEAIETIRSMREEVKNVYYLFVVNDREKLVGVISMKDLVLANPQNTVHNIMNPEVISVRVDIDQEEVAQLVKKYNLVSIPVVDDQERLVGRITHDDIIDVIEEEADEDISRMAGVINQEIAEESATRITRARLPWLVGGLGGGILAAGVINQFETSLERVIALAFFFPVIMAMGGSTGTQAATVMVRGLATGDISLVNIGKRLWVEIQVALLNGVICGILLGIIVSVWLSDYGLGLIVTISMVLIILVSGFIGAAVPLVFRRLNIDPALATGPLVTTSNDILSLFIYLGLVTLFLRMTS
jgi:magnesium transporter